MARARDPQQYNSLLKLMWEYTDQFWIVLFIFFVLLAIKLLYLNTIGLFL